ncbi:MAG: flagellar hook assembly protein FlgD [Pseudomonadota bacterium]
MDNSISKLVNGLDALSSDRLKTESNNQELGQAEFLELMMTQLQNQDPLNPAESGEFLSQIAQFGTVNGITELQQSFSNLASSLQSSQALQASTMVGRSVLVEHDQFQVNGTGASSVAVDLPQSVADLQVTIRDAAGQLVKQFTFGPQSAGVLDIQWDGIGDQGERVANGVYTVEAEALIDGQNQSLSTLIVAPVESVSLSRDGGDPTLNVANLGSVALGSVRRVL